MADIAQVYKMKHRPIPRARRAMIKNGISETKEPQIAFCKHIFTLKNSRSKVNQCFMYENPCLFEDSCGVGDER